MSTSEDKFNWFTKVSVWLESALTGLPERLKSAAGAAYTAPQNTGSWSWPDYDYTWDALVGAAAGVLHTTSDISGTKGFSLDISALTATSVDIYTSLDGSTFTGPVMMHDASTAAPFATAAITAVGQYYLKSERPIRNIRIDQVGAGGATMTFAHGNG